MTGPWREPAEESVDLYPGLVVCDDRVTGSITFGPTRLPLWAPQLKFIDAATAYAATQKQVNDAEEFLRYLLDLRGEFGRLLLLMADAERRESNGRADAWWETKRHRKRVGDQLHRCLEVLDR